MDTIKDFYKNFNRYRSGEMEHDVTSSVVIQRLMFSTNIWRVPLGGQSWLRVSFSPVCYILSLFCCFIGHPRELNIPEWGKFINILAGVLLSMSKMTFLYLKRHQVSSLIAIMNAKSQELKKRGQQDVEIKRLRDSTYVQEMVVLIFTHLFGAIFLILIFVQVLFVSPMQLVVPLAYSFKQSAELVTGPSTFYWTVYVMEVILCSFDAFVITLCDVMIGNIYNQLILHLEVLHYDVKVLDGRTVIAPGQMAKQFCEFAQTYQSLRQLNDRFYHCFRPFFINNLLATVLATTFSCVEMGIMINVDITQCIKPCMYFLFISLPFFYWCWLGNRLIEKSTNLALAAYIYNERASTVAAQKLQLLFIHQVQNPIAIDARPFIVLNFDIFVRVMKVAYQFTVVFKNIYARQRV